MKDDQCPFDALLEMFEKADNYVPQSEHARRIRNQTALTSKNPSVKNVDKLVIEYLHYIEWMGDLPEVLLIELLHLVPEVRTVTVTPLKAGLSFVTPLNDRGAAIVFVPDQISRYEITKTITQSELFRKEHSSVHVVTLPLTLGNIQSSSFECRLFLETLKRVLTENADEQSVKVYVNEMLVTKDDLRTLARILPFIQSMWGVRVKVLAALWAMENRSTK